MEKTINIVYTLNKLFSIILLALFCYLIAAPYVCFKIQRNAARKEVKTAIKLGVPIEKQVRFVFTQEHADQLKWTKPEKEFMYKNEMYDVIRHKTISDSIHYVCIHDVKESNLFKNLSKLTEIFLTKNPLQKEKTRNITQFIKLKYNKTDIAIASPHFKYISKKIYHSNSSTKSYTGDIYVPPENRPHTK